MSRFVAFTIASAMALIVTASPLVPTREISDGVAMPFVNLGHVTQHAGPIVG
jgi:hypothetical protein